MLCLSAVRNSKCYDALVIITSVVSYKISEVPVTSSFSRFEESPFEYKSVCCSCYTRVNGVVCKMLPVLQLQYYCWRGLMFNYWLCFFICLLFVLNVPLPCHYFNMTIFNHKHCHVFFCEQHVCGEILTVM